MAVLVGAGTYRLYRRDAVQKGNWYYVVNCKECGKHIYTIDDQSRGKNTAAFAGISNLSAPCRKCNHEGIYSVSDLSVTEADEDIPSSYPKRVPRSQASRKPITKSYSQARATFGVGYIEDRPVAAALVGRIITSWADIEIQCARLLAELMGVNIPAAAAVFGSLRSSRAQHDALNAAAKTVLDEKDYELFCAHMSRKESLEKERNDLTHGCFGVSVGIPDHIVWVAQSDFLIFTTTHLSGKPLMTEAEFRAKQFVYELGTLERIAAEIAEFYDQLSFFNGYLVARHDIPNGPLFRVQRYSQLCSQPHIRQALDRVRTAKKSSQAQKK